MEFVFARWLRPVLFCPQDTPMRSQGFLSPKILREDAITGLRARAGSALVKRLQAMLVEEASVGPNYERQDVKPGNATRASVIFRVSMSYRKYTHDIVC